MKHLLLDNRERRLDGGSVLFGITTTLVPVFCCLTVAATSYHEVLLWCFLGILSALLARLVWCLLPVR